jgi:hypothetical protein
MENPLAVTAWVWTELLFGVLAFFSGVCIGRSIFLAVLAPDGGVEN